MATRTEFRTGENSKAIRPILLIVVSVFIIGCVMSPDSLRRRPWRDMQVIAATRPAVATCISKLLKESTPSRHTIVESADSVQLKTGDMTLRVFDLEDAPGGTMVTLFIGSPFHVETSRQIIDKCRLLLESQKTSPQPLPNQGSPNVLPSP